MVVRGRIGLAVGFLVGDEHTGKVGLDLGTKVGLPLDHLVSPKPGIIRRGTECHFSRQLAKLE